MLPLHPPTMFRSRRLSAPVLVIAISLIIPPVAIGYTLDGKELPTDWVYGCATSAYQVEGAWNADGKGV